MIAEHRVAVRVAGGGVDERVELAFALLLEKHLLLRAPPRAQRAIVRPPPPHLCSYPYVVAHRQ